VQQWEELMHLVTCKPARRTIYTLLLQQEQELLMKAPVNAMELIHKQIHLPGILPVAKPSFTFLLYCLPEEVMILHWLASVQHNW